MTTALAVQEAGLTVEETRQAKQLEALERITSEATPEHEIRWRDDGGRTFPYTDPAYVIRTLNDMFLWDWDFEVDSEQLFENNGEPFEIKCRGRLTVRIGGRAVVKCQYGGAQVRMLRNGTAPVTIADMYKAAGSDALKKCAAMLGIALDLYDSDSPVHESKGKKPQGQAEANVARDPQAKTLGDLVTPKQLWMMRNMARELNADIDEMCREKFNCAIEEISKKGASVIIDALKAMSTDGGKMLEQEQARAKQAAPANGPSRKAVFERKHSPEIGKRFDELVRQLTLRDIKADELLREANVALHDSGRKQIKTRYDADDESAEIICNTFEAWIQIIDREQQKSRATQS